MEHNSLKGIPTEIAKITGLTSLAAEHNYLDCTYIGGYISGNSITCETQYRLITHTRN